MKLEVEPYCKRVEDGSRTPKGHSREGATAYIQDLPEAEGYNQDYMYFSFL